MTTDDVNPTTTKMSTSTPTPMMIMMMMMMMTIMKVRCCTFLPFLGGDTHTHRKKNRAKQTARRVVGGWRDEAGGGTISR